MNDLIYSGGKEGAGGDTGKTDMGGYTFNTGPGPINGIFSKAWNPFT